MAENDGAPDQPPQSPEPAPPPPPPPPPQAPEPPAADQNLMDDRFASEDPPPLR